jgi:2-oxoacid:acceptor oxidoreductase delta subunit (pyruvate/2-ketoisovalerate family)
MRRLPIGRDGMYVIDTGSWRQFRPVVRQADCTRCGICLMYCPVNAVRMSDGEVSFDLTYCKGCGICKIECPKKAIDWVEEGC